MTVLARNLGLLQAADLLISSIASSPAMPLNISLTGQLDTANFSIQATLDRALSKKRGPPQGSGELRKPERDTDSDAYGENGERMPYYPARPRELRSGELNCPLDCDAAVEC